MLREGGEEAVTRCRILSGSNRFQSREKGSFSIFSKHQAKKGDGSYPRDELNGFCTIVTPPDYSRQHPCLIVALEKGMIIFFIRRSLIIDSFPEVSRMNADTIFYEGKKRFATGHPGDSIDLFTRAAEEGCNPVNVYLNRGVAYLATGNHQDAEADFSRVLAIDDDNERAHYYRGVVRLIEGKFDESVEDLTASLAINHERGVTFLARGIAYAELGREEEALQDFKTATVFSSIEVGDFLSQFGSHRTIFDRSMALLEGERGPWKMVLTEEEVEKTRKFFE